MTRQTRVKSGDTPCLTVIQVPPSAQPIVETATFGSRATCEQFVRLSRPALNEEAKPVVYKSISAGIIKDALADSLALGLKR